MHFIRWCFHFAVLYRLTPIFCFSFIRRSYLIRASGVLIYIIMERPDLRGFTQGLWTEEDVRRWAVNGKINLSTRGRSIMEVTINQAKISLVRGDITQQSLDA